MSAVGKGAIWESNKLTDTPVLTAEESTGYARAIDLLTVVVGLVGIWNQSSIIAILSELTVTLA
jgi:hypothetical protein